MMPVFWEEFRRGVGFSTSRGLAAVLAACAVLLPLSGFHPGFLWLVWAAAGLAGGLLSGLQHWNEAGQRTWLDEEGLAPHRFAAGKTAGLAALLAFWSLALLPGLLLTGLPWNLPAALYLEGLAWTAAGGWAAQALGQAAVRLTGTAAPLTGGGLAAAAVFGTLTGGPGTALNPLWQLWKTFGDPGRAFDLPAWLALAGLTLVLWLPVFVRGRKREAQR